MKVYPGDKINASAMSYYTSQGGFSKTAVGTMAGLLAPVFGGVAGVPGDPGAIFSNVGQAYGTGSGFGLSPDRGATCPSAFLNYILFDKDYKPIAGQSVAIATTANAPQALALPEITALELGYVFIYLSYDNDTGGDVFFDDLKITVKESPVIQVNNYYPFGMQSYTWIREGETDNAYLFQGKELIAQTGWHDFGSRMYYGDLGRWFATDPAKQFGSPYLAMGNMPNMSVDPDGQFAFIPFLVVFLQGAGYVTTSVAIANGFMDGGTQGGLRALATAAVSYGVGSLVGGAIGGLLPSNIYGSVPGALWGSASGALSGGLTSGTVSALGGGDFWDGARDGAIAGAITGALSGGYRGYLNAKNDKYDRNLTWGNKTEIGYEQTLNDAKMSLYYCTVQGGNPNIYVANDKTLAGSGLKTSGRRIRDSKGRIANAATDRVLSSRATNANGDVTFDSKIFMSKRALKTFERAHDIMGHELQHAIHSKNGSYSEWYNLGIAGNDPGLAERLGEQGAYHWQIHNSFLRKESISQYNDWRAKYYGN